jgi:hydroxymethylpyrimidine pyrophosphatase-like HAD family hydrolase
MAQGVQLVVTDLDGTLWDPEQRLHPATVGAIAELERRGVPLLVATGRRVTSTRDPLARAGLFPPAVVLNGALALDLSTGVRFHRQPFSATDATFVLEAFASVGLEPCVYVDDPEIDVFVGDHPSTHPLHIAGLGACARHGRLDEVVVCEPVLSFGIMGRPAELLEPARKAIGGRATVYIGRAVDFGDAVLTVAPTGLSKWAGVEAFCQREGLDPGAVLAVGDGANDVEMLDAAAVAVVPSEADAGAAVRADHVIGIPADGGWAEILDLLTF